MMKLQTKMVMIVLPMIAKLINVVYSMIVTLLLLKCVVAVCNKFAQTGQILRLICEDLIVLDTKIILTSVGSQMMLIF